MRTRFAAVICIHVRHYDDNDDVTKFWNYVFANNDVYTEYYALR